MMTTLNIFKAFSYKQIVRDCDIRIFHLYNQRKMPLPIIYSLIVYKRAYGKPFEMEFSFFHITLPIARLLPIYLPLLKTLDTSENCLRPVVPLGVSKHMHEITNL